MSFAPTLPIIVMESLPDLNARLVLKSVDPARNRFRLYQISIVSTVIKQPVYVVTLSWGRIGSKRQQKSYLCKSQTELDQVIKPVIRTRHRHRYQLALKTKDFPGYAVLEEFPYYREEAKQLRLF